LVRKLSKYEKLAIVGTGFGTLVITTPLALSMLPQELQAPYMAFKVWLLFAIGLIFLFTLGEEK